MDYSEKKMGNGKEYANIGENKIFGYSAFRWTNSLKLKNDCLVLLSKQNKITLRNLKSFKKCSEKRKT